MGGKDTVEHGGTANAAVAAGNGGDGGGGGTATTRCGFWEWIIFITAIAAGTACSICSKTMMELHGIGITGELELFEKPIFQTFGMFIGMLFGLVMHWAVVQFRIPFPGYEYLQEQQKVLQDNNDNHSNKPPRPPPSHHAPATEKDRLLANGNHAMDLELQKQSSELKTTPGWMYWFLAIPSIFDLGATAFCMMGLVYLDVSIYLLLRGSGIIFVALMKQHVLRDRLYAFQWVGVVWNVISVVLVGATAMLNSSDTSRTVDPAHALVGVVLVLLGAFVQSLQFVFEEKVMHMDDAAAPPLLLIGMEGLWGTVLCLVIVYPLVYYLPGDDHGSYEDPFNSWAMFMNSANIQWSFVVYFFTIFAYNLFAVLVTFKLNSVWHAILDNFRPITVWCVDMLIFYVFTARAFGEPWTQYSWIQAIGMVVLIYGTAVYNAPNAGSIRLDGRWYSLWFNFTREYGEIETHRQEEEMHREWEERRQNFGTKRHSSLAERSPYMSVHTQALRGLASPKI